MPNFSSSSPSLGDPYAAIPPVRRRGRSQGKGAVTTPVREPESHPEFLEHTVSPVAEAPVDPPQQSEVAAAAESFKLEEIPVPVQAPARDPRQGWRQGDSGLGLPDPMPTEGRRVNPEETEAWEHAQADHLRERVLRQLAAEEASSAFRIPASVLRFARSASLLGGALLGIILVAQVYQFYGAWVQMELPWRWLSGGLFAILGGILTGYILRMFWFVARLRGNRQVSVKALKALQERRELQTMAAERASDAVRQLRHYLTDYPAQKPGQTVLPGVSAAQEASLIRARASLLERSRGNAPSQWIGEFRTSFQEHIDQIADRRVNSYAKRAGLASAASPNALLDQAIVLYTCTAMLGDLMKLYQLRPGFGQSAVLLGQCIAQTYLAGLAGEGAEEGASSLGQALEDWIPAAGSGIAKGVGARTAEGGLNWFLVRRLGRAAIRILQPVRG